LPGGAAVGSVSLPSLARALEAIRRLVAIGALDGALIGGIGSLGGGPSITLPELQRPTSLSVQGPGGSTPKLTVTSGTPNPAAKPTGAGVPTVRKPGIAVEAKWGDPTSTKAYGHSYSKHGPKRPQQQLIERARSTKDPQGQWLNGKFIVEAEQRAPLRPGAHVVEFDGPVGNVYRPDGTVVNSVRKAIVVRRPDLTLKTTYPIE
jgi:hypothetical protein